MAKLPKINFMVALLIENLRSCWLDLGRFLATLMTLMALKAAVDINQAAANVNLGAYEGHHGREKVCKGHCRHQTFDKCGLT